ncbi:G2/M phase-specific E3 ubiquitin-protein ligase-like [Xyrauchen texanus]|uniref:G2/M phase-specific E3 ubiquitin-protein ligase-like n=1 Tax=Xyrauchen texanus TaxID=154827 RepID=UPI00224274D4|nr:G2/M phase-specific E3 ubiquitin-protein ligase-like [Xyrauchen texanus]
MKEVRSSLGVFEGQEGNLFFTYDQSSLEQGRYYTAGKLTAWSLIHGGPGLKALDPALYLLMCGQDADVQNFQFEVLPDREVQENVQKIKQCSTEDDLVKLKQDLGEWIAECGVPQIYNANLECLPQIYGQIVKHFIFHSAVLTTRSSNMITQFKQGLNSCGQLWETVERHWNAFRPLFTHKEGQLTRLSFRALFKVVWSEEGSNRREAEEDTMFSWECLLSSIEEKRVQLTFEDLLTFVTGADAVPPLGFPQQPEIQFYDQEGELKRFPYASTCSTVLYLPRGSSSEDDLFEIIIEAVHGSAGFGKI